MLAGPRASQTGQRYRELYRHMGISTMSYREMLQERVAPADRKVSVWRVIIAGAAGTEAALGAFRRAGERSRGRSGGWSMTVGPRTASHCVIRRDQWVPGLTRVVEATKPWDYQVAERRPRRISSTSMDITPDRGSQIPDAGLSGTEAAGRGSALVGVPPPPLQVRFPGLSRWVAAGVDGYPVFGYRCPGPPLAAMRITSGVRPHHQVDLVPGRAAVAIPAGFRVGTVVIVGGGIAV